MSDDNAFVERLSRTAEYRPEFPDHGFADLEQAQAWAARLVHWYSYEHKHRGIRYVSRAQRDEVRDHAILAAWHELYQQAR